MKHFFERYPLENQVIAAGVSGGADSLALVLRLKDIGRKVVALSVDHGLRPTSRQEAEYVAELMQRFGIEHHILIWEGEKPSADIEAAAREARYALLCGWCKEHGVSVLAVGHHRRDQAETFLLRLQRGSGLYGLSCMQPLTYRDGICLIRPQLDDSPDDLKAYLKAKNIEWVEDESNQSEDFLRVKIRKFLPELERKIGLSEKRLADTAAVLARSRAYFEDEVKNIIANRVRCLGKNIFSFSAHLPSTLHSEIAYRLLAELLQRAGNKPYAPEADELLRLAQELKSKNFKGCTLGGCEIMFAQKRFWIIPELREAKVLGRDEWEKCLQFVPQYANAELPYKVRRALYFEIMKVANGKES